MMGSRGIGRIARCAMRNWIVTAIARGASAERTLILVTLASRKGSSVAGVRVVSPEELLVILRRDEAANRAEAERDIEPSDNGALDYLEQDDHDENGTDLSRHWRGVASMRFIVWIKERRAGQWEEQGDGALPLKTAQRIEREIRHLCWNSKVMGEGFEPAPRSEIKQERKAE